MVQTIIAIVIFLVTITAIITDKINSTTAAICGMVMLIVTHVLTLSEAVAYIDFDTIGVLVGMMLFVGVIKHSGLFEYISIRTAKAAKGDPWKIMVLFIILTALCSAFLDNVTTVLLMGPMTITIARILDIDAVPVLMGQILASNIAAKFTFGDFLINTGVPCVFIIIGLLFMLKFFYGKELVADERSIQKMMMLDENKAINDPKLMKKSIVMIALVVLAFLFHDQIGLDTPTIALTAGAVMMLIGHVDVEEVVANVEWTTLLFFIGLFVLVGGLEKTGVIKVLANMLMNITGGHVIATMMVLLWASAMISAVLNNIPFVATLIPLIQAMGAQGVDTAPLWWAVTLGACLGGNGTLIGASANVVLSNIAGKHGYPITFNSYLKKGMPVMLMSIVVSSLWLLLKFAVFK